MKQSTITDNTVGENPGQDLGLYIHIPFCKTICVYCAFSTFANKHRQKQAYLEALRSEIHLKSPLFKNDKLKTIYFGGGTPSILEISEIASLLKEIRNNFRIDESPAIEIEGNPESLTLTKLKVYKKLGINRLSLGVQSLNDKTLWKIARPHNSSQTVKALQMLKKVGWTNFGCDFIIGLPYQRRGEFLNDLREVLKFKPAHISTYFLSYDTHKIDTFIKDSPSEEEQVETYLEAEKMLQENGFQHYEVSNYAKPGHESRHNLRYWNQWKYLGVGLGAHSFLDKTVSENTSDFNLYLKNPVAITDKLVLDEELLARDSIMLNLRLSDGINLEDFSNKYGKNRAAYLLNKATPFIETGHLQQNHNKLACTTKGWLILDTITRKLCN